MRGALAELPASLARGGFDVVHPFDPAAAARTPGLAALAGGPRLGLLVGNTRALWPIFTAALATDPALAADPDPLDRYTERTLDALEGATVFYGHRRYADGFLPLQHLAVATGLGALAANHLVIHPTYGPWFALRAAILIPTDLAGEPPPIPAPIAQPCQCTAACATALADAHAAMTLSAWLAVRDACSMRAWRYPDDQIAFHYNRPHLLARR